MVFYVKRAGYKRTKKSPGTGVVGTNSGERNLPSDGTPCGDDELFVVLVKI